MSAAYQCDRCGEFVASENYARKVCSWKDLEPGTTEIADYAAELCSFCARDFDRWTQPPPKEAKP